MTGIMQTIAVVLLAFLLLQAVLLFISSWRRHANRSRQQELSLKCLQTQIDSAKQELAHRQRLHKLSWQGYRKFEVKTKTPEGDSGICSFQLVPHDGKPLPPYQPGQFLTFKLSIPGQKKPVIRCYSLSDCYRESDDHYRVTIKKIPAPADKPKAPPGLASSFFYDHLNEGDILDVKAPAGQFVLDLKRDVPVVLLAGGVGITPLLSMLNAIVASGQNRETWLFYGVRNRAEHIMKEHMDRIRRDFDNVHICSCYSDQAATDTQGHDYHCAGRITVDLLKEKLPSNNYEFYICGPPPMMAALTEGLKGWGVPQTTIKSEAFGAASVQKAAKAVKAKITFTKSKKDIAWDPQAGNLLEFALRNGIPIDSGCRAGSCGTCKVALRDGKIEYVQESEFDCEPGSCLTCLAMPKGDITLDA